jgi:hypothetical protein
MYALIYDEHRLERPLKQVISIHKSRQAAETALEKRKARLGRRVWECHTRIVWTEKGIKAGDSLGPGQYQQWRPGEKVPVGEMVGDTD